MSKQTFQFKRWHKIFFVIFVLTFVSLQLWNKFYWPTATIELKEYILNVQVANTIHHMEKGLGGRSAIGKYDGMLFLFDFPGRHAIVMRDMHFPIDIVWFLNGEVVDIAPNVPIEPGAIEESLWRYYPRKEANAVLELPAGWTGSAGLKIGDRLRVVE